MRAAAIVAVRFGILDSVVGLFARQCGNIVINNLAKMLLEGLGAMD